MLAAHLTRPVHAHRYKKIENEKEIKIEIEVARVADRPVMQ